MIIKQYFVIMLLLFQYVSLISVLNDNVNPTQELNFENRYKNIFSSSEQLASSKLNQDNVVTNPLLNFSTYFGGSDSEILISSYLEINGNIIIVGFTYSADFPTLNAYQDTYGGNTDIFLAKFSPNGKLLFSTYFGGQSLDFVRAIDIDSEENIIISGYTLSNNLPTLNAYQDTYGDNIDTFLAKFSPNGELLFSTYFGGISSSEVPSVIEIDSERNIVIAGQTTSVDFPILNAYQEIKGGGSDYFLAKFSSSGDLLFSTYFGGFADEEDLALIKINLESNIIMFGKTQSLNFPILNASQDAYGGGINDYILAKFSPEGDLVFSTYLGGSGTENLIDAHPYLDSDGNIILSGQTTSEDFPTLNAFQNTYGGGINDYIVTKFSTEGELLFSTYFGGSGTEYLKNSFLDSNGNIILSGQTTSEDFPTLNASQDTYRGGENDIILVKFSTEGELLFSTYFGGSGSESLFGNENSYANAKIRINPVGNIILTGETSSADFPILNAYQDTYGGGTNDYFLIKFSSEGELLFSTYFGGSGSESCINNSFSFLISDSYECLYIDSTGDIYIYGTSSNDLASNLTIDSVIEGKHKISVSRFSTDGLLIFSTSFGNLNFDITFNTINFIIDSFGNFILMLGVDSGGIPTKNAFNDTFNSKNTRSPGDIIIIKINNLNTDKDSDGMHDYWEQIYGLDLTINDSYEDKDDDGIPNIWEYLIGLNPIINDSYEDKDGDGMPNLWEFNMGLKVNENDSWNDKDGDGMPNLWEYQMGLNATNSLDGYLDKDGDGLYNIDEYIIGTSAINLDTDGDGMDDGYEYQMNFDPLVPDSHLDSDGDYIVNLEEYRADTDPNNFFSFPLFSLNAIYLLIFGILTIIGSIFLTIFSLIRLIKYKRKIGAPTYFMTINVLMTDFDSYKLYRIAKLKGASSVDEYKLVLKYKVPNFSIVSEIMEGNFPDYYHYLQAKALGASTMEKYDLVKSYNAPDYSTVLEIEEGKFPSYELFGRARLEGFTTYEKYKKRIRKNYK